LVAFGHRLHRLLQGFGQRPLGEHVVVRVVKMLMVVEYVPGWTMVLPVVATPQANFAVYSTKVCAEAASPPKPKARRTSVNGSHFTICLIGLPPHGFWEPSPTLWAACSPDLALYW
jgi:hypothetical protein